MRGTEFRGALEDEWHAALAHAGLTSDRARLWLCEGADKVKEDRAAVYHPPMLRIEDDDVFLSDGQRGEAQQEDARELHRIAIFEDYRQTENDLSDTLITVMGGVLRHELQHALQQEACGSWVLEIEGTLIHNFLARRYGGLPDTMAYYNVRPMEQDANAAAAIFLRERHPEHVDAILKGPCAQLARSNTGPEAPESLVPRMVGFLYGYRDLCEAESAPVPFWKRLDMYDKRAGRLWQDLDTVRGGDEDQ
jgi:hypothetical protein